MHSHRMLSGTLLMFVLFCPDAFRYCCNARQYLYSGSGTSIHQKYHTNIVIRDYCPALAMHARRDWRADIHWHLSALLRKHAHNLGRSTASCRCLCALKVLRSSFGGPCACTEAADQDNTEIPPPKHRRPHVPVLGVLPHVHQRSYTDCSVHICMIPVTFPSHHPSIQLLRSSLSCRAKPC
jgi:hypothetical protein